MKRKIALLIAVLAIALAVALPTALSGDSGAVDVDGDATTLRNFDSGFYVVADDECPSAATGSGGC